MISDEDLNEICFRLQIKQLPNLNSLSELHYLYYMIGFNFFESKKIESKSEYVKKITTELIEVFNYFSYEMADLKALLFDLSCGVRGVCGSKQSFNINELPSMKMKKEKENKIEMSKREEETEEERLQRHIEFFKGLRKTFDNK